VTTPRALLGTGLLMFTLWSAPLPAGAATKPLPQTTTKPSFGAPLTLVMRQLFRAIEKDSPVLATPLFFPEAAYLKMKTGLIANPAGDYLGRLVAFYDLDLRAYHQRLIGQHATTFVRVVADPRLVAWIAPGACENRIGYWHEPGVRLVVERDHRVVSAAVASLISWRGVWYVVHLGPNPRPRNVGTVAGFALGSGTPGPGGGC